MIFQTNSQLKEKVAGLEASLEQSANDLKAAQTELTEALKAKEDLIAKMNEINTRAEKAEADLAAAQSLIDDAQAATDAATESEAKTAETVNAKVSATVATIGAEPVPAASAEMEPDIVSKWKALQGQARLDFFKSNSSAIKKALGMA